MIRFEFGWPDWPARIVRLAVGLALGLTLVSATTSAWADCSRPIRVPVAPIGMSVVTSGGEVSGIYPDLLRKVSAETGCQFDFVVVPRARVEAMFAASGADALVPATRTSQRDLHGDFIPMMKARAMLISISSDRAPVESLAELGERRELRVAVVRTLERNLADVTVMAPSILAGTLLQDSKTRPLLDRLRLEAMTELNWTDSGIYLSRHLPAKDREVLGDALERNSRSGTVWKALQKHYPAGSYEEGLKALAAPK